MSKTEFERVEWFALRYPKKKEGGGKKEVGPRTHRDARMIAAAWYEDGYKVELQRRRQDAKAHVVVPKFPGIDRRRAS